MLTNVGIRQHEIPCSFRGENGQNTSVLLEEEVNL